MLATMAEAHNEWHANAGVPVGLPCPMDACDPSNLTDEEVQVLLDRKASIKAAAEAWEDSEEAQATCEHGMSAWLCSGPNHYPMDYPSDW
jgi:hypothetical protein